MSMQDRARALDAAAALAGGSTPARRRVRRLVALIRTYHARLRQLDSSSPDRAEVASELRRCERELELRCEEIAEEEAEQLAS